MKNQFFVLILASFLFAASVTSCGEGITDSGDGDSNDTIDGDLEHEQQSGEESEEQTGDGDSSSQYRCTPREWTCYDERTAALCDEYGAGYIETIECKEYEICRGGECTGDIPEDGDDFTDGDETSDGDESSDGDDISDGDEMPDGDETPDGDEMPDGDEDEDSDIVEHDYDVDDGAFSSCNGLTNTSLRTCLHNLIDGHTSLGYDNAREVMYDELDNQNGEVCCVYTGICVDMKYSINAEHTWPQSYGADSGSAKSDLHHLFPTESTANSIRGNYRFGNVVGTPDWQQGGSKKGDDENGSTVFEVRDDHKGDTARAVFYMAVRYNGINDEGFLTETQEAVLRQWHWEDPPDEYEVERNNNINKYYQHNRNPFIDRPDFVDAMENFDD